MLRPKEKNYIKCRCLESWTKEKGGQLSQALSLQQGILCIGMKKNFKVSLNFNTQAAYWGPIHSWKSNPNWDSNHHKLTLIKFIHPCDLHHAWLFSKPYNLTCICRSMGGSHIQLKFWILANDHAFSYPHNSMFVFIYIWVSHQISLSWFHYDTLINCHYMDVIIHV